MHLIIIIIRVVIIGINSRAVSLDNKLMHVLLHYLNVYNYIHCRSFIHLNIKVGVSFEGIHKLKKNGMAVDILTQEWEGSSSVVELECTK